jgi:hypothetical protein
VLRDFFRLLEIGDRLRGLVDVVLFVLALLVVLEAFGRGGGEEGRLRLDMVGAIRRFTLISLVWVSVL